MNEESEQTNARDPQRPFWQWMLLAVLPGILSDVLASLGALAGEHSAGGDLAGLVMACLLAMPLLTIPYLIVLSKRYVNARRPPYGGGRAKFVIGFCIVNLFLWGGSCVIVLSNLDFH